MTLEDFQKAVDDAYDKGWNDAIDHLETKYELIFGIVRGINQ